MRKLLIAYYSAMVGFVLGVLATALVVKALLEP